MKLRTPLSARVLSVMVSGDPAAAERLRQAMTVPSMPAHLSSAERALVEASLSIHLFHSFAARSHPLTVRRLLSEVPAGAVVLDPFLGSGTVLVEAALIGARGVGLDIGALQVRLCRFKATPIPASMRRALLQRAESVAEASAERVRERTRPRRTAPWDQSQHYEPHVFLELCGLREEIERIKAADPPIHEALLLIFSALVVKASRQRSESRTEEVTKALSRGQVTRWFMGKAQEVVRLHEQYAARVPAGTARPQVRVGDARADVVGEGGLVAPETVDVVVTSPPYLGVYDYAAHHARRCAWLGIDLEAALAGEIGARRAAEQAALPALQDGFQRDTDRWVAGVGRALRAGGQAYVIVGDSVVGGQPVDGMAPVAIAAQRAGLRVVAACSVTREEGPREDLDRREHLLHLQRP